MRIYFIILLICFTQVVYTLDTYWIESEYPIPSMWKGNNKSHHNLIQSNSNYVNITQEDVQKNIEQAFSIITDKCFINRSLSYILDFSTSDQYLMKVYTKYYMKDDIMYPSSMFESDSREDFKLVINTNIDWALTEDNVTGNNFHMRSILIHELLHVLGFDSVISIIIDHCTNSNSPYSWCYPTLYDTLINFDNTYLLSNLDLEWKGKYVYIDNIRLYNPYPFMPGSSLVHIHNDGFLMSHSSSPGIIYNTLDNSITTILQKLTWDCNNSDIIYDKYNIIISDNTDNADNTDIDTYCFNIGIIIESISIIIIVAYIYHILCKRNISSE